MFSVEQVREMSIEVDRQLMAARGCRSRMKRMRSMNYGCCDRRCGCRRTRFAKATLRERGGDGGRGGELFAEVWAGVAAGSV